MEGTIRETCKTCLLVIRQNSCRGTDADVPLTIGVEKDSRFGCVTTPILPEPLPRWLPLIRRFDVNYDVSAFDR